MKELMETLKTVWDEDPERCYNLYRIAGKMVRVRRIFGGRFIAEIFSPALRWEFLTMPTARILKHTKKDVDQITMEVLREVRLILGASKDVERRTRMDRKLIEILIDLAEVVEALSDIPDSTCGYHAYNVLERLKALKGER